jgi:hypothetical protein
MGLRFRKSIRVAPGIRMNFGLKSLSVSAGVRGLKYTTGTRGRRITVGLPGSGLFWTSSLPRSTGIRYPAVYWILFAIVIAIVWKAICS